MKKRAKIREQYLQYLEQEGKRPKWLFRFLEWAQLDSEQFEQLYGDLAELECDIWSEVAAEVNSILQKDAQYPQYSAAEKLLAYYYTLLQTLSQRQASFESMLTHSNRWIMQPAYITHFRKLFLAYVSELVQEGIAEGSIASRFSLDAYYRQGLWLQCAFILNFWSTDSSTHKASSDEVVERAVVLSFELMGHNALDSALGLGKFLINRG